MAQRIDDATKSWFKGLKFDESKTTKLANDINKASCELSLYVTRMKNNLSSFVSVLEKIGVTVRKERTLAGRILGWLKSLFKALAKVFISPFRCSVAPGVSGTAPASSTLEKGAAAFCGAGSGAFFGHTIPCKDEVTDSRCRTPRGERV
jgi:hypothetical protein